LGKALKDARLAAGITNVELAKRLGISRPALINMQAGRQRIQLHTVFTLEQVLGAEGSLIKKARSKKVAKNNARTV
jgi:transcriptional regulator with XRE-family HTH domain